MQTSYEHIEFYMIQFTFYHVLNGWKKNKYYSIKIVGLYSRKWENWYSVAVFYRFPSMGPTALSRAAIS